MAQYQHEVIFCIVNAGYSEAVMDAAKEFGARGGTVIHAKGTGMELAEKFVTMRTIKPSMFYVWGHGYEFDGGQNWDLIEKLVSYMSENGKDIWFATNGEILDYIQAYQMLEYSVDGSMIYNPSAIDVEIMTAFGQKEILKAGKITEIGETPL